MPEPPTNPEPMVYQLRVVLRGVSPLIWRRLLIRSNSGELPKYGANVLLASQGLSRLDRQL